MYTLSKNDLESFRALESVDVPLNNWRRRSEVLSAIPKSIYHNYSWQCSLPDDPFPRGKHVYLEQRSTRKKQNEKVINFRDVVFDNPTAYLLFGQPNEIEYSANVIFSGGDMLKLPETTDDNYYVYSGWRDYYTTEVAITYDNDNLSCMEPTLEKSINFTSALRIDRQPWSSNQLTASAKLKVYKRNIFLAGLYKITLTGAIEASLSNDFIFPLRKHDSLAVYSLPRGNKSLLLRYWGVAFRIKDMDDDDDEIAHHIIFRVCFRQPASIFNDNKGTLPYRVPGSDTRCNIECEDNISGDLFVRILRILYFYYRYQFEHYGGLVLPYRADFTPDMIEELDPEERNIASTYTHIPLHNQQQQQQQQQEEEQDDGVYEQEEEEEEQGEEEEVGEQEEDDQDVGEHKYRCMVRVLGLHSFISYDPQTKIRCKCIPLKALLK
nr:GrBNV gp43-like protein [Apis mellifera nudivirus]